MVQTAEGLTPFTLVTDKITQNFIRRYVSAHPELQAHVADRCGFLAFSLGENNRQYLITVVDPLKNWETDFGYSYWIRQDHDELIPRGHECGKTTLIKSYLLGWEIGEAIEPIADQIWEENGYAELERDLLGNIPAHFLPEHKKALARTLIAYMSDDPAMGIPRQAVREALCRIIVAVHPLWQELPPVGFAHPMHPAFHPRVFLDWLNQVTL